MPGARSACAAVREGGLEAGEAARENDLEGLALAEPATGLRRRLDQLARHRRHGHERLVGVPERGEQPAVDARELTRPDLGVQARAGDLDVAPALDVRALHVAAHAQVARDVQAHALEQAAGDLQRAENLDGLGPRRDILHVDHGLDVNAAVGVHARPAVDQRADDDDALAHDGLLGAIPGGHGRDRGIGGDQGLTGDGDAVVPRHRGRPARKQGARGDAVERIVGDLRDEGRLEGPIDRRGRQRRTRDGAGGSVARGDDLLDVGAVEAVHHPAGQQRIEGVAQQFVGAHGRPRGRTVSMAARPDPMIVTSTGPGGSAPATRASSSCAVVDMVVRRFRGGADGIRRL